MIVKLKQNPEDPPHFTYCLVPTAEDLSKLHDRLQTWAKSIMEEKKTRKEFRTET